MVNAFALDSGLVPLVQVSPPPRSPHSSLSPSLPLTILRFAQDNNQELNVQVDSSSPSLAVTSIVSNTTMNVSLSISSISEYSSSGEILRSVFIPDYTFRYSLPTSLTLHSISYPPSFATFYSHAKIFKFKSISNAVIRRGMWDPTSSTM